MSVGINSLTDFGKMLLDPTIHQLENLGVAIVIKCFHSFEVSPTRFKVHTNLHVGVPIVQVRDAFCRACGEDVVQSAVLGSLTLSEMEGLGNGIGDALFHLVVGPLDFPYLQVERVQISHLEYFVGPRTCRNDTVVRHDRETIFGSGTDTLDIVVLGIGIHVEGNNLGVGMNLARVASGSNHCLASLGGLDVTSSVFADSRIWHALAPSKCREGFGNIIPIFVKCMLEAKILHSLLGTQHRSLDSFAGI